MRGQETIKLLSAPIFHAIWTKIVVKNPEAPQPSPRTSHTCVSYKNRYLVIIGGETTLDQFEGNLQMKQDSD